MEQNEINQKVIEFLESVIHGPVGSIPLPEYEKFIRKEAIKLLEEIKRES